MSQGTGTSSGEASLEGLRLDPSLLSHPKLRQLNSLIAEKKRREYFRKFERYAQSYSPAYVHPETGEADGYHKHRKLMSGHSKTLVAMAANRIGKTEAGAFVTTCHLTGNYPDWWQGKRFTSPTSVWVAGITGESTRDIVQLALLGDVSTSLGSGMIPLEAIAGTKRKQGSVDAVDVAYVRHVSGGLSILKFKSMEQGRGSFQGTAKHFVWLDEEPEREGYDIYSECDTRTMTTGGQVLLTWTPLKGMSELSKFMLDHKDHEDFTFVNMTWDDAPHLSKEEREKRKAAMKPHEVEARTLGVPTFKEGLVYPFADSEIVVEPFPIPRHWPLVIGMDVGWTAPTAAILLAQDPKTSIWYAVNEYVREQTEREKHARAIKAWGTGVYIACDPAANRTEGDGTKTMKVYKDFGLNINNAKNDVDDGIEDVYEGFSTGKLKIFKTCTTLIEERRFYQYKMTNSGEAKPKKVDDHCLDALRYGFMARGFARTALYFENTWNKKNRGVRDGATWSPVDRVVGY